MTHMPPMPHALSTLKGAQNQCQDLTFDVARKPYKINMDCYDEMVAKKKIDEDNANCFSHGMGAKEENGRSQREQKGLSKAERIVLRKKFLILCSF